MALPQPGTEASRSMSSGLGLLRLMCYRSRHDHVPGERATPGQTRSHLMPSSLKPSNGSNQSLGERILGSLPSFSSKGLLRAARFEAPLQNKEAESIWGIAMSD